MNLIQRTLQFFGAGYDGAESSRFRRDTGWSRNNERDEDAMLARDRSKLRIKGVDLRRNSGIVAGFCSRLAKFVIGADGISPAPKTSSKQWNKDAADYFWKVWGPVCDSRGRCTLQDFQYMSVFLRPIHGGIYFQLLNDGTIRPIECDRIRNPRKDGKGEYTDGVKVDQQTGRIKGYLVHSRDKNGDFGGEHDETFVSAESVLSVISPPWRADMVREVPDLAHVLPLLQDVAEMNKDTLATAKAHAKIVGWLKKQSGNASNVFPLRSGTATPSQRQTFNHDWGSILELFPNEDVGGFNSTTPNNLHIPYMQWQLVLCAAALDLPYEFLTLDFSKADWSRMKGILTFINQALRPYRNWLNTRLNNPLWAWTIGRAVRRGILPKPPAPGGVSELFKIEWHDPEQIWVDRQEAVQSDMLEYQMGQVTLTDMAKRRGKDLESNLREIAEEKKTVAAIETEYGLPAGSLVHVQIPGQNNPAKAGTAQEPPKRKAETDE